MTLWGNLLTHQFLPKILCLIPLLNFHLQSTKTQTKFTESQRKANREKEELSDKAFFRCHNVDDHNFLVRTWDFTGRNVIFNRRNIDKTCKTTPDRGKFNSLRRDHRSCGNNPTLRCVFWLALSPPRTSLLLLGEMCWNRLTPEHRIMPWVYYFAPSTNFHPLCKDEESRQLFISKNDRVLQTPLYNTECGWERQAECRGRMERRRRKGDDKYVPHQNFYIYPRPALLWPDKPGKVLGEGGNRMERESWCGWGPRWLQSTSLCVLPPILSPAANFLNEPQLKNPQHSI